jgi:serine/threonine protein phosphatase PrpC
MTYGGNYVSTLDYRYGLNVTRSLGDFPLKMDQEGKFVNDLTVPVSAIPDVHLIEKPSLIIMHSDGIENAVTPETKLPYLFKRALQGDSAEQMGQTILDALKWDMWGKDNMSLIVLPFKEHINTNQIETDSGGLGHGDPITRKRKINLDDQDDLTEKKQRN